MSQIRRNSGVLERKGASPRSSRTYVKRLEQKKLLLMLMLMNSDLKGEKVTFTVKKSNHFVSLKTVTFFNEFKSKFYPKILLNFLKYIIMICEILKIFNISSMGIFSVIFKQGALPKSCSQWKRSLVGHGAWWGSGRKHQRAGMKF